MIRVEATTNTIAINRARSDRRRWIALFVVCLGQLMIILDTTIVNVALPSIQSDLDFSQSALTWVIDGYLITFGSLLLLSGRLGDLFGRKRIFLLGVASFTAASVLCGLAPTGPALVVARFLQGAAASLASAVIIAIIAVEFREPAERAKAMSLYTFVIAGGASLGLLLGGALTEAISWHWIFFINVPIGIVTVVLGRRLIAENEGLAEGGRIDWLGSMLITAASIVGIYALVKIPEWGWTGERTLAFLAAAAVLLAAFVALESRIANPIMPLRVLGLRSLITANLVRGFLVTGAYSTFFLGSLYFEHVRGMTPIEIGLAFLAMSVALATMSAGLAARLVARFGPKPTLVGGIVGPVAGLLLFSQIQQSTPYFPTIFAAFALLGFGFGAANPPLMMIAMDDVPARDAGLASGTIQVSIQLSAAIGLAALGTIATDRTDALSAQGQSAIDALSGGYHLAFLIAAGVAAIGIAIAILGLRNPRPELQAVEEDPEPAGLEPAAEAQAA
ncbi:MAG TPA: MFS transporter [Solirubrobacterales bacterium]|jgi:EmrB/QacA subfamily drug resistance transporter